MTALLDLKTAQEKLLALAPLMGQEDVATDAALGRVIAADLVAKRTQPDSDLSAMDGYAIAGNGPWNLVGESRAGVPFAGKLVAGQAVRISTGAQMPIGSESVLIQENAVVDDGPLTAQEPPSPGQHVRKRGFDFVKGAPALRAGDLVTPGRIALALSSGYGALPVRKQPKISIVDCGDELARNPDNCGPGLIPASNGAMIAAMLQPLVGPCDRIGPVRDEIGLLAEALGQAQDADILITSGGASVGDHDLIQQALKDWGADLAYWKVAIKPGKPLLVATRKRGNGNGHQVILGLPGNPVSSFVTCFLFALPLIRAAYSMSAPLPVGHPVTLAEPLPATGSRQEFLRGTSDGVKVRLAASQDSSALMSLAHANCLIDRAAGSPKAAAGEQVTVYNLQNG